MTYPVTVYRWDDPGAPQIAAAYGTANEIKAILQACLVTGYGSKAPLGWTKVFDDAGGVVWQNKIAGGGSGGMFRIKPKSGNWSAALGSSFTTNTLEILTAKSFIDSTTPEKPGNTYGIITNSMTSLAAPNVYGWVLIGTAIGFYIEFHVVDPTRVSSNQANKVIFQSGYQTSMYIGDVIPTVPGDAYTFTCLFDTGYTLSSPQASLQQTSSIPWCFTSSATSNITTGIPLYDTDGGEGIRYHKCISLFVTSSCAAQTSDALDLGVLSSVYLGSLSTTAANAGQTGKHPLIRCFAPGLFVSPIAAASYTHFWPTVRNLNGENHWVLAMYQGSPSLYGSNVLVNMVEW